MSHILLTGFTPFDGRACNASWIAARQLTLGHRTPHILHSLRIPVCWGEAARAIPVAIAHWRPELVIAMGEGEKGGFRIETLARNARRPRLDNAEQLPPHDCIEPGGPDEFPGSAPFDRIEEALANAGIPVRRSTDAGGFLCEEALFTLERCRADNPSLQLVLFVHLPPFGSTLHYRGEERLCDNALLADFGARLLDGVLAA